MAAIARETNQETPQTRVCEQEGVVVVRWWPSQAWEGLVVAQRWWLSPRGSGCTTQRVVVVVVREQNVDQNVDVDQQRWHMISGPVPIVYPLYTRNTVEKGTVLPGYGNQEPVPETAHTRNHFTTVLPVPMSCLTFDNVWHVFTAMLPHLE